MLLLEVFAKQVLESFGELANQQFTSNILS